MSPETAATNLPIGHLQYDNGKHIDYWLSDTDTVKLKNSIENVFQYCFVCHKYKMDYPGNKPGPLI
jgi:hypothetical protein